MKALKGYLELLGLECRDVVTGATGIVTSVSFDLFGCVQGVLTPPLGEEKKWESRWFDAKRLHVIGTTPVMVRPTFEDVPGPEALPALPSQPAIRLEEEIRNG